MTTTAFPFRRELLPPADSYYRREVRKMSRVNRSGWAVAICPFHDDKRPSFSVNVRSGAFNCFSCGARGGSVIDFVMQRDNVDFKSAAMTLGAWEQGAAVSRDVRAEMIRHREQRAARDVIVDRLLTAERELRVQYHSTIHALESSQRNAAERLQSSATTAQERDDCWAQLQILLPELRENLAAYALMAFAPVAQRIDFITRPDNRDAAIQAVLGCGFVRDDAGKLVEVTLP